MNEFVYEMNSTSIKFIREFLNDIYLGKVSMRRTLTHDLPEAANRTVLKEAAEPPRFCILKGFKLYVSVIIYVDDETYSRIIPKHKESAFEEYGRKIGLWKDMSLPNFEGELVSHLGRKSAEMASLKAQVAFLREKVRKLEQVRRDWLDWGNEPRASLDGKSIKEWAYLETRMDNLAAKRPAQRASDSVKEK